MIKSYPGMEVQSKECLIFCTFFLLVSWSMFVFFVCFLFHVLSEMQLFFTDL